jgi:hypothetical protein
MRPTEIESALWNDLERKRFSKNPEAFHVHLHRALKSLTKDGLLSCREMTAKDTRYSIKDRERVQTMVDFNALGWHVLLPPKELVWSRTFAGKTSEAVQSLSRYILQIISLKAQLRKGIAHTSIPGAFIYDVALPLPEQGGMVNDRFLIVVPDDISTERIKLLTNDKYKDFLQYLTSAWALYFEERNITHGNIVILHFPDVLVEKAKGLVERGEARDIAQIVSVATKAYVDQQDPSSKPHFEVKVDGPFTNKAIETGLLKGGRKEAIMKALEQYEKKWAKHFMKEIG